MKMLMKNESIYNLIDTGLLENKKIFSTNRLYKRFLKSSGKLMDLKPRGLWYGIGDSWFQWCCEQNFDGIGKYIYEIKLCLTNILSLNKEKDIFCFSEKYAKKISVFSAQKFIYIDWLRVMKDYDGIEISPYFPNLRFTSDLLWYYGWDIPSGCIWRSSAKKKITLLAEYQSNKKEFLII